MRIISVRIHNFLSFDDFTWPNLDPHLNVIVGANGAGKSNLIAAIKAVADIVNVRRTDTTESWRRCAHNGNTDTPTEIMLEVAFDDIEEQRLLAAFFAAALCREEDVRNALQQPGPARALNAAALAAFSAALMRNTDAASMAALCRGKLVVHFAGMNWYSYFESIQEPQEFTIGLTTQLGSSYLLGRRSSSSVPSSLFAAWLDSLTPTAQDNVDAFERGGELEDLSEDQGVSL